MRFMVIVKANEATEGEAGPSADDAAMLEAMGRYNEELVKAGVMLDGAGLKPSSAGARVLFDGEKRSVVDGPFAETKELIAGYWIFDVSSLEECIEWVKKCPNPTGEESAIEIRPLYEEADFDAAHTDESRATHARVAEALAD